MWQALFWLFLFNAVLLINHEIESAYWREWELFRLPGGISGFLVIHFPLLFVILYGIVLVYQQSRAGLMISMLLCAGGVFAFCIHTYFIRKGGHEFTLPISRLILYGTLLVSLMQGIVTVVLYVG